VLATRLPSSADWAPGHLLEAAVMRLSVGRFLPGNPHSLPQKDTNAVPADDVTLNRDGITGVSHFSCMKFLGVL
jgi:hypothetical protein